MGMSTTAIKQRIREGEDLVTEFKRRIIEADFSIDDLLRNIVALANTSPINSARTRLLLIGVEDDGKVTGYRPFQKAGTANELVALIQDQTIPPLVVEATVHVIEDAAVLAVEIPDTTDTQFSPTCTNKGLYVHRLMSRTAKSGPMVKALEPHTLWSRFKNPVQVDWASLRPPHLTWDDLDPLEFDRFRKLCSVGRGDRNLASLTNQGIAEVLGICNPQGNLTIGAALLFGTEATVGRLIPNHEVQLQVLEGTSIVRNERTVAPLFRAAEQIENFFSPYIKEQELHLGMLRIPIPNLPAEVLREAVCNALVHRSYTHLGPTTIAMQTDEFLTSSPGGFPAGISVTNILTASNPRSRILAEAFKRAGLVDRTGRGVQKMVSAALSLGVQEPSFEASTEDLVQFSYYMSHSDQSFIAFTRTWESSHNALSLTQLRVTRYLWQERAASAPSIREALALTEASLKNALKDLSSLGIVEKSGKGSATMYSIPPSIAHDSVPSLTPEAAEEKVLAHVAAHGSITRAQTEKLTGQTSQQAYRLLSSLVEAGDLVKVGTTRNTSYKAAD